MGADDSRSPADACLERIEALGTTDDRTRTLALLSLAYSARELCGLLASADAGMPIPVGVTRAGRIVVSSGFSPESTGRAFDAAGFEEYLKAWNEPRLIEPRLIDAIVRIAKIFTKEKP